MKPLKLSFTGVVSVTLNFLVHRPKVTKQLCVLFSLPQYVRAKFSILLEISAGTGVGVTKKYLGGHKGKCQSGKSICVQ